WRELAGVIAVMRLGHWLEVGAFGQARGALAALAELIPDEAEVVRGETTEIVPISALQVGDIVLVRPGGRIPAGGVVITGSAEVDESMVTGESRPVLRAEGE